MDNTRNLADFTPEQLLIAAKLLAAYKSPLDISQRIEHPIAIELNPNSGYVFIVAVRNFAVGVLREDGRLDDFLICQTCKKDGHPDELSAKGSECCQAYVRTVIRLAA